MKKRYLKIIIALILAAGLMIPSCIYGANGFKYQHDPMLNPSARQDIIEDPEAIYGYRPNNTGSISLYADADWTDSELVAAGRADRIEYHNSINGLYEILEQMTAEGKSTEEIARVLCNKRNELRLESYKDDPEGLADVKARNLEKYGHEEGPLPDEQYAKYGSWQAVISKAFNSNAGMDACLGLYDDLFDFYVASGYILPDYLQTVPAEYALSKLSEAAGVSRDNDAPDDTAVSGGNDDYDDGSISRADVICFISGIMPELQKTREALSFNDMPESIKPEVDRLSAAGLIEGTQTDILSPYTELTVLQLNILCTRIEAAVN